MVCRCLSVLLGLMHISRLSCHAEPERFGPIIPDTAFLRKISKTVDSYSIQCVK